MNCVKRCQEFRIEIQNIRLNEFERIVRLFFDINTHYFKASFAITCASSSSATKQIEESEFFSSLNSGSHLPIRKKRWFFLSANI